jgi:DNA-binding response OmpR family regulator
LALKSPANDIYEATNGVELVQLLVENDPFDLVVTDVRLPWMDGLEVLRSMRVTEVATPVLMITRLMRSDLQAEVDHLGNSKLLHKPFGLPELRAAVFDLMSQTAAVLMRKSSASITQPSHPERDDRLNGCARPDY